MAITCLAVSLQKHNFHGIGSRNAHKKYYKRYEEFPPCLNSLDPILWNTYQMDWSSLCHWSPTVQPRDLWIPGKHQSDLHITILYLKTGDRKRLLSYSLSDETHRHVAVSNYQSVRHSSNFVFDSLIQLPKLPRGAACTHRRVQYFFFKHAIHYTKRKQASFLIFWFASLLQHMNYVFFIPANMFYFIFPEILAWWCYCQLLLNLQKKFTIQNVF